MGLGTFLDLSANDLARFRLPFGLLESFRSDYFDVSFSSSLRLKIMSREVARVMVMHRYATRYHIAQPSQLRKPS